MSHDTHQEQSTENKSIISFKNSFWLVIILVFLFVGAINFVQAQGGEEESKTGPKEKTEMKAAKESAPEKVEPKAEQPKADQPQPATAAGKESGSKDPE